MTKVALLALSLLSSATLACEPPQLPLSGTATVETCSQQDSSTCIYGGTALYEYMEAVPDSDAQFIIGLQASPWHLYDGELRIITPEEMAEQIRPKLTSKVERVELVGSWTAVAPAPGMRSSAERLSKALGGFPVQGEDGFLWLSKDGSRRTTHQAFTLREGAGAYFLPKDAELMVALVAGWPAFVQGMLPEDDAELQMRAAVGWDVFFLCPDNALSAYEYAASKGSAIAAYNAAMMHLERGTAEGRASAVALLERGAALGDAKSRARLDIEHARDSGSTQSSTGS